MSALTEKFTLQLSASMREALNRRAAQQERSPASVIRRSLAATLSLEDDSDEETADQTPELPLA